MDIIGMTEKKSKEIRRIIYKLHSEIPHIRAHREEDDFWTAEGTGFLKAGEYKKAERKFKELILAQPDHHDGYEGLALVYCQMGKQKEARILINEAVRLARGFLEDGSLDKDVLDEILAEKTDIESAAPE